MEAALHLVIRVIRDDVLIVDLAADLGGGGLQSFLAHERNFAAARELGENLDGVIHEDALHRFEDLDEDWDEIRRLPLTAGHLRSRRRRYRSTGRHVPG